MKDEAHQINRFLAHGSIYFQQRKSKLGALFIYYGCNSSTTLFISEANIDGTCRVARVWIKVNSPVGAFFATSAVVLLSVLMSSVALELGSRCFSLPSASWRTMS